MELEAWIKPVNSRLRFCLCNFSLAFITNRRVSFCSIILIIGLLTLSSLSRSGGGKCHSPLLDPNAWNRLNNSFFLLPLAQIPAATRLSIHDSPFFAHEQDTVATFPAPPDPTGKVFCPTALPPSPIVSCLANNRCNKTYWRLTP